MAFVLSIGMTFVLPRISSAQHAPGLKHIKSAHTSFGLLGFRQEAGTATSAWCPEVLRTRRKAFLVYGTKLSNSKPARSLYPAQRGPNSVLNAWRLQARHSL